MIEVHVGWEGANLYTRGRDVFVEMANGGEQ